MTVVGPEPGGRPLPTAGTPSRSTRRRRRMLRFWLIVLLVGLLLTITATGGVRSWWAHRLHDITGGGRSADFAMGVVVGLLPLAGVAIGSLGAQGARRVARMFVIGAAAFCITYLLSPSPVSGLSGKGGTHVFNTQAPGYLPGVVTGEAVWLLALVLVWLRFRRWRRARFGP